MRDDKLRGLAPAAREADRLTRLALRYPLLADIDHTDWLDIVARAHTVRAEPRTVLLSQGIPCESFVLLLDGSVRVYQLAEDGREITLYRIAPGDICVMSLASLVHSQPFRAFAQSDSEIDALAIPARDFHHAMTLSTGFRDWVLRSTTNSFCEMLDTFHGAVFDRLEMRLACLLGQLFERTDSACLQITHQQLAQELGTTREVISRSLKRFERQGCVELSRGAIRIAPGQQLPLDVG
jgi:CRP/FNR family transcriptional regulator